MGKKKTEASIKAKVYGASLLFLAFALIGFWFVSTDDWRNYLDLEHVFLGVAFLVLLASAEKFPLLMSSKVKIVVDTSLLYAVILLFPPPLAAIILLISNMLGHVINHAPKIDLVINAGIIVVVSSLTQWVYTAFGGKIPFVWEGVWTLVPLGVAAVTQAFSERLLVAVAFSLYFGARMWGFFVNLWQGAIKEEIALYLLGLLTVMVVEVHPWGLLLTAIPVALVYLSLRNSLRLQVLTRDAVEKMADVIDRRDPYTAGHSIRVAELAARIATEMGLPWEEVETIKAAARVHDLGKIEIDSIVLNKPGRLDDREWELMQRHPIVGAEIISRFPEFARGADYIRYHHERWDGKGYPYGLRGEEIPLGARIIAVADSYDAMTTDRPYRRALSRDVVMAELKRGAGVQWDPAVVAAFLRILGDDSPGQSEDAVAVAVP